MKGINSTVPMGSMLLRNAPMDLGCLGSASAGGLTNRNTTTAVIAPRGRLIQKHQRQVALSVKTPRTNAVSYNSNTSNAVPY